MRCRQAFQTTVIQLMEVLQSLFNFHPFPAPGPGLLGLMLLGTLISEDLTGISVPCRPV